MENVKKLAKLVQDLEMQYEKLYLDNSCTIITVVNALTSLPKRVEHFNNPKVKMFAQYYDKKIGNILVSSEDNFEKVKHATKEVFTLNRIIQLNTDKQLLTDDEYDAFCDIEITIDDMKTILEK